MAQQRRWARLAPWAAHCAEGLGQGTRGSAAVLRGWVARIALAKLCRRGWDKRKAVMLGWPGAGHACCTSLTGMLEEVQESENHRIIGWKRPLRSLSPTIHPTPPFLLQSIPKCHIYTFLKHLQGWWLSHFLGQPIPMPDHSFSKEIFPDIQSKCPLTQLEAIAFHPIARYLGEGINTCLITTSF